MDIDVKPVRPLSVLDDIWSQEKLVVSKVNLDWFERYVFGNLCGQVNNAIVYARDPLHPVMWQVIDAAQTGDNIWLTTGPCMFSSVVTAKTQNNVLVLDCDYFEPTTMSSPKVVRPDLAVIIHEKHMSWIPSHIYWLFQLYTIFKKVLWLCISLFLFCLLFYLLRNYLR
jgi:mannosyltransferase OCH1-like enzyme